MSLVILVAPRWAGHTPGCPDTVEEVTGGELE